MERQLFYSFYDAGAYDGETEHRIMFSFYSDDGVDRRIGQSELVLASEAPAYHDAIQARGWIPATIVYPRAR
jgi:hypothetical protein